MGLVLDSSVIISAERGELDISLLMKKQPRTEETYLTSLTVSEVLHGCERTPEGKRKEYKKSFIEKFISKYQTLGFWTEEARIHAKIWANLDKKGIPLGAHDLIIGAICIAGGHRLATLNTKDFERIPKLKLVDVLPYKIKQKT